MKKTLQRTVGFLGITVMATQLIGATTEKAPPFRASSEFFEHTLPVTAAQKDVEGLLKEISANAAVAARHGEKLESYARGGHRYAFTTHAFELNGAKEAVNAMGADLRQLQDLRPNALPWQQMVIEQMQPLLVELAGHTNEAIERLNDDRGRLMSPEYRDAVGKVYASASKVYKVLSVSMDYAEAREKLNRLDGATQEPRARLTPVSTAAYASKAAAGLEKRVRSELLKLPYYGVFDYLAFQVNGDQITLKGDVSRPTMKGDAERVVRKVEGVTGVTSDIKVLPLSPNDNRLRMATYWAVYGHSTLARYRLNPNPPIRIIVENGNVTLKGTVASDMDRSVAYMQANGVAGAFSVTNELRVGS